MSNISPAKHHTPHTSQHTAQCTANRGTPCNQRGFIQERKWLHQQQLQTAPIDCEVLWSFPLQYYGQVMELDTGLLPLLYTPFRHVYHSTNDSISRYLCVLDMQITQSAQSLCRYWVYMSAAPCRRVCTAAARPAWFGDYKYKYHLTTNTVGTTGTCGHGV